MPDDMQSSDSQSPAHNVWPYHNEAEARKAAQAYASLKTPMSQKAKILERIFASIAFANVMAPVLMESVHRCDIAVRHEFLDFFARAVGQGQDLSEVAEEISKMMMDPNFALREKAATLLIRMGPMANGATVRAIGYLRSKMVDLQENALRLLAAIGPVCARQALPKIESMLKGNLDKSVVVAARNTLLSLRGEVGRGGPEEDSGGASAPPEAAGHASAARSHEFPDLSGKRILIADDEEGIRRMLANSFASYGAIVTEVHDGMEALAALQGAVRYDMLLVDLLMPKMSGAEVLRLIRENSEFDNLPIYVISARTERSLLMAMAKLRVAGYFMKPFKLRDILVRANATFANPA